MLVSLAATAAGLTATAACATPETTMLGSAHGVAITGPHTAIDIPVPTPKLRAALAGTQPVQLVLRDVAADSPPGTLFDVYVARTNDPAKREHVGTISWFGAFMHRRQPRAPEHRTLTYDVTAALRALGGRAVADAGLTVAIEATTGRAPASGSARDIAAEDALAAQAFRPEAHLRIASVELYAGAPPAAAPGG